ncbi:MAG: glycoside hydrolase family 31 protein [Planctomycetota bacterium]|jgi:alpha-glucosidase
MPSKPNPTADPASTVRCGHARFTVLTAALLRLEWSPDGRFEDGASQVVINRHLPPAPFEVEHGRQSVTIRTGALTLRYRDAERPFDASTLRIELARVDPPVTWVPGRESGDNLRGTARTLDSVSGACPLESGLLSREGWSVLDDSHTLIFEAYPAGWLRPRGNPGSIDLYFFGHGRSYARILEDFVRVAGRIPLPPRYVFGNWWSRYWPYSQQELKQLVAEFCEHDVPLDVLCIDMDWHLDGWTGYTWNPKYFPDPDGFLRWLKSAGLRAGLNLHPAEGVGRHEARFEEMASAMGLDPAEADRVPFDCTDPRYMKAYFEILHHPLERQGIDFWWIDWQQGNDSAVERLDPLWWCCAYWSHDIGGHFDGPVDPELCLRWIQFGVFSPVLRTHAARHAQAERRIWAFEERIFRPAREAFRLRHALLPYIYTAARQAYDTGVAICRPMYYEFPELDEAYEHPGQYMFGADLIVAPVVTPVDPASGLAERELWLPPGSWTHLFTGQTVSGPCVLRLLVPLDEIPVFVRSGGLVSMRPVVPRSDQGPADPLALHVFPGPSGAASVYEDDGETIAYQDGAFAVTTVSHSGHGDRRVVHIDPAEGAWPGMREERVYEIHFRYSARGRRVTVDGTEVAHGSHRGKAFWYYDEKTLSNVICLESRPVRAATQLEIEWDDHPERR